MDKPTTARRSALDVLAGHYGVKRRWFGLEPDFMLRRRAYAAIIGTARPMRGRINWWNVWTYTLVGLVLAATVAGAFMFAMAEPIIK